MSLLSRLAFISLYERKCLLHLALSHAGPYSLVHACWITVCISIIAAKVPKKFSAREHLLTSAQNDEELKKNQRNNIMNKEERNS